MWGLAPRSSGNGLSIPSLAYTPTTKHLLPKSIPTQKIHLRIPTDLHQQYYQKTLRKTFILQPPKICNKKLSHNQLHNFQLINQLHPSTTKPHQQKTAQNNPSTTPKKQINSAHKLPQSSFPNLQPNQPQQQNRQQPTNPKSTPYPFTTNQTAKHPDPTAHKKTRNKLNVHSRPFHNATKHYFFSSTFGFNMTTLPGCNG